ncbi:hypothetical protein TNCV_1511091 [Trichonephila clavipes]|nr:hypothetical protein TNCV_1511091 [Trichonephila clavipes]
MTPDDDVGDGERMVLLPEIEESVPESDEIGNAIEEAVHLAGEINLEVDSDFVQQLLDSQNLELAEIHEPEVHELIEIHEPDIEYLESLDPVPSEDRTMVGNWIEGINLIQKV